MFAKIYCILLNQRTQSHPSDWLAKSILTQSSIGVIIGQYIHHCGGDHTHSCSPTNTHQPECKVLHKLGEGVISDGEGESGLIDSREEGDGAPWGDVVHCACSNGRGLPLYGDLNWKLKGGKKWSLRMYNDRYGVVEWNGGLSMLICTYLSKGSSSSCEEHKVL